MSMQTQVLLVTLVLIFYAIHWLFSEDSEEDNTR